MSRTSTFIEEDEFIAPVTVANQPVFNVTSYPVNIGQSGTFPWGNTPAKNYQKYEFEFLEFYYKREVSEFATAGTTGKVMLFFNADASDGPPTTKQQIEDSMCHADGMPSENIRLIVPPRMLKRMTDAFFIRIGGLPGSGDIKTFDVGSFHVATQGITTNAEVGELHVRYRVRLSIPVINGLQSAPTNNSISWFQSTATEPLVTTVVKVMALATTSTNGLNATNTTGSIVLPAGNYVINYGLQVSDSASEALSIIMLPRKNGVLIPVTPPSFVSGTALGAGETVSLFSDVYVSSNGTDVFTLEVQAVGAAGSLSATGTCLIAVM
jgi:hypothetical protein